MRYSRVSIAFFCLVAFVQGAHNLDYSDLQALDTVCPLPESCFGYRNYINYLDRNCKCAFACGTYWDCCIDSTRRRRSNGNLSTAGNGMVCMRYPEKPYAYSIAHCLSNWNGSPEVRKKCEGSEDFGDPLVAAPVTSVAEAVTYKNRYCAECNNAALSSLAGFQIFIGCKYLPNLSSENILADITYNQTLNMWGIRRTNSCYSSPVNKSRDEEFSRRISYALSFADLLAYGKKRGNKEEFVDETTHCPKTHHYNPKDNKCREIFCSVIGYVLVNGKCFPRT